MTEHFDELKPLVSLRGLTVDFDTGRRFVRALHGVDLDVHRGETLGIVGESGCGKSITWLAATGLLDARARIRGSVKLAGEEILNAPARRLARLRGGRIALIFQDPSSALNPVHRIGRQIGEALWLHRGLRGKDARREATRLLERVGISNPAQRLRDYPHELSGGMNQRVMIAMALAGEPELLIADEPTTALDATIQAQILDLLGDLRRETGMAMVLISHDLGVVSDICDRVAVMYCGRVIETAGATRLFSAPAHPYSIGLMRALPVIDGPRVRLDAIPGTVPAPDALPPGCTFAPRCAFADDACSGTLPGLRPVPGGDHRAACLRIEAVRRGALPPEGRVEHAREVPA
ncbi:ABC transporter ATP-binding protein [Paroceanicella profunda]|uniref:ABC transporter ATP-binding protein n=1 Tax=Paroceanicella profunda TaxID=2579971 RepID=A0A5B8FYW3_9RHOB|nr:ABC transporter ATP-binding protein [Paroceanicella profunda]QDL93655.1 ABC transporter ATP-binding protein [Paroceanicella profunda]